MVKGSQLKKAEANQFVKSILQAMFIQTDEEQEEVTIPVTDNLNDDPSLTQALKNLDPKVDSKDSANVSLAEYLSNKKSDFSNPANSISLIFEHY